MYCQDSVVTCACRYNAAAFVGMRAISKYVHVSIKLTAFDYSTLKLTAFDYSILKLPVVPSAMASSSSMKEVVVEANATEGIGELNEAEGMVESNVAEGIGESNAAKDIEAEVEETEMGVEDEDKGVEETEMGRPCVDEENAMKAEDKRPKPKVKKVYKKVSKTISRSLSHEHDLINKALTNVKKAIKDGDR